MFRVTVGETVTAHTLDVFTGAQGTDLTFEAATVLLVRMSLPELRFWAVLLGGQTDGTAPVEGYEVRAADGALLGAVLPLGHMSTRLHVEWYDPAAEDFFPLGDIDATTLTHGISRVLEARRRHVDEVPLGRELVLDPEPVAHRRNKACPFTYCFDTECIDHGPVWAAA
ncbi:hypothetical protein ACIRLA_22030 [Streptomyces sp. NPDC102364]|uniref:hypothetical protein n=1 Tax=Streptomyces sp. NPDC102364 TaxID=3366161 RepID=UPI00381DAAA0